MANILVIGSSGTVGTELVRLLRAQGHTVSEATSRAPTRAGQVQLDIVTGAGTAQAFGGIERAFLLSPRKASRRSRLPSLPKIIAPMQQPTQRLRPPSPLGLLSELT